MTTRDFIIVGDGITPGTEITIDHSVAGWETTCYFCGQVTARREPGPRDEDNRAKSDPRFELALNVTFIDPGTGVTQVHTGQISTCEACGLHVLTPFADELARLGLLMYADVAGNQPRGADVDEHQDQAPDVAADEPGDVGEHQDQGADVR